MQVNADFSSHQPEPAAGNALIASCAVGNPGGISCILRTMVRSSVTDESMVEQEVLDWEKYLRLAIIR